jgi:hypothetical protein
MADITEAYDDILKKSQNNFKTIDYFFLQRTLTEEHEYFDKQMNRQIKKVKVVHNFLALNIPTLMNTSDTNSIIFDIEIYGDEGYHYKGTITSYKGNIPNFMIPIKGDKKLFIHINHNLIDSNKTPISTNYVNFIEVPKRHQSIDNDINIEN